MGYVGPMTGHIKISMDPAFAEALLKQKRIVIRLVKPGTPARGAARRTHDPSPGTHMARLVDWARKHGKPFRTRLAAEAIGVTPRHASVLLVNAVQGRHGIVRLSHGVYRFQA